MAKLYFRYGAMNCGKSTHLLQVAHNYEETGQHILLIKPSIDTKGENKVVSRIGAERVVDYIISPTQQIRSLGPELCRQCILVDEAQFLTPSQVDELYIITKEMNIPVICYGLRCDFQMMGFPGATRLLEIADDIEEMKTICRCGSKATQNMRLLNGIPTFNGDQVLIDGSQDDITYQAVCGKCYNYQKTLSMKRVKTPN